MMLLVTPVLYHAFMAEPTQEDIDAYVAGIQSTLDGAAALGETLTWDEARTRFNNLLTNVAKDPEGTAKKFKSGERLDTVERDVANLTDRVAHLEDIGGT